MNIFKILFLLFLVVSYEFGSYKKFTKYYEENPKIKHYKIIENQRKKLRKKK